jgi:histone H3/H4
MFSLCAVDRAHLDGELQNGRKWQCSEKSSGSGPERCIKLFSGKQDLPVILSLKSLLAELRKRDDQGSWLLTLLSFLSPEHIPHTLFDGWLSIVAAHVKFNLESDKLPFYEVVAQLRQPALVNSSDPGSISINPLVQRLARETCTEREGWLMSALKLVHRAFSAQPDNLLSHAVTVASHAEMEQVDAPFTDNTTLRSDLWEGVTNWTCPHF